MSARSGLSAVIAHHAAVIDNHIQQHDGWQPGTYELQGVAEWDHGRLPIVVADSERRLPTPMYAVLPAGDLVSDVDDDALSKIITAVFADPGAGDAYDIARLTLWFGNFDEPPGEVVTYFPTPPPASLPRKSAEISYRREGDAHVVSFYSFDANFVALYDCVVRIESGSVEVAVTHLNPEDDEAAELGAPASGNYDDDESDEDEGVGQ